MKRQFIFTIAFLLIGAVCIFNGQAQGKNVPQTDVNRYERYEFKSKTANFYLKLEGADRVYLSYEYQGYGTLGGKWTQANGVFNANFEREGNWSFKFKSRGNDLEIAESLPPMSLPGIPDFKAVLSSGTIFKRLDITPSGEELTPAELGKRAVNLVKSINAAKDLAPENIERQIGIKIPLENKNVKEYGVWGMVKGAANWTYSFRAYPYPLNNEKKTDTLAISFNYQLSEPIHPDKQFVCEALDFKTFSSELQKAGFSAPTENYGEHGRFLGWDFMKSGVSVKASAYGKNCVEMVIVSISDFKLSN